MSIPSEDFSSSVLTGCPLKILYAAKIPVTTVVRPARYERDSLIHPMNAFSTMVKSTTNEPSFSAFTLIFTLRLPPPNSALAALITVI